MSNNPEESWLEDSWILGRFLEESENKLWLEARLEKCTSADREAHAPRYYWGVFGGCLKPLSTIVT